MRDLLKNSIWIFMLFFSLDLLAQEKDYDFTINIVEGKNTKVIMMDKISKGPKCMNCASKLYDYLEEDNNTMVFVGLQSKIKSCIVKVKMENDDEYKIRMLFSQNSNANLNYDIRSKKALKALQEEQQKEGDLGTTLSNRGDGNQKNSDDNKPGNEGDNEEEPEQKIEGREITDDKEIAEHIKNIMSNMDGNNKDLITQVANLVSNFQTYCNFLTEPSRKLEYEIYKKQLRELFFDPENAIIQVVNRGQVKPETRTLEEYMNKVISLQKTYKKFRYKDKNVQIVGKLRPKEGEEGIYTAIAVFTQEFSAVVQNKEGMERLLKTERSKYVEIVVKVNRKMVDGELKYSWKAYLQNITANKSE